MRAVTSSIVRVVVDARSDRPLGLAARLGQRHIQRLRLKSCTSLAPFLRRAVAAPLRLRIGPLDVGDGVRWPRVGYAPTTRKAVAVVCIALVVFAAFVPAAASLISAALIPLWLVLPAVAVTVIRRRASRCSEQPVSLLSLLLSRAPPISLALA